MLNNAKIEQAEEALRLAADMSIKYYQKPLIICYSGGKDSDVLLHLAMNKLQPDEFEVINSHTTVDAPETVYHIRKVFKRLNERGVKTEVIKPTYQGKPTTMWKLIPLKGMPPTRLARYCCSVLKEASTPNRMVALGVRKDESTKRRGRDLFGIKAKTSKEAKYWSLQHAEEVYAEAQERDEIWDCQLITAAKNNKELVVNPIYEWSNSDIWGYIRHYEIEYNPLYDKGFLRVGCIGCPFGGTRSMQKEFAMYPKYKRAYMRAFEKMIEELNKKGKERPSRFDTAQGVMDWWIDDEQLPGQLSLDDLELPNNAD